MRTCKMALSASFAFLKLELLMNCFLMLFSPSYGYFPKTFTFVKWLCFLLVAPSSPTQTWPPTPCWFRGQPLPTQVLSDLGPTTHPLLCSPTNPPPHLLSFRLEVALHAWWSFFGGGVRLYLRIGCWKADAGLSVGGWGLQSDGLHFWIVEKTFCFFSESV